MPKSRLTAAARIRQYFMSAPLAEAKVMRDLAQDIVRERIQLEEPGAGVIKPPRKPKVKPSQPRQALGSAHINAAPVDDPIPF